MTTQSFNLEELQQHVAQHLRLHHDLPLATDAVLRDVFGNATSVNITSSRENVQGAESIKFTVDVPVTKWKLAGAR